MYSLYAPLLMTEQLLHLQFIQWHITPLVLYLKDLWVKHHSSHNKHMVEIQPC